jgi:hypothetical protein
MTTDHAAALRRAGQRLAYLEKRATEAEATAARFAAIAERIGSDYFARESARIAARARLMRARAAAIRASGDPIAATRGLWDG